MQNPFGESQVLGVVYNTSMSRPDAALALCALYGFEGKRESRMGSVCVSGGGLNTAIFCDLVGRMYMLGPPRNSNSVLPVGLPAVDPPQADAAMIRPALERRNEKNELQYARTIRRASDTAVPEAVLRNGVLLNSKAVVILSAPATWLARTLDLPGVQDIFRERVQRLVVVDSGTPRNDAAALRRILAQWPTPIVFCGREAGETLLFPGASVETGFNWTPAHPVLDAYRAFRPMPYDAPSYDVAASHYAVHPDSGFFRLSEPGSVLVSEDGGMQFSADGAGKIRRLIVEPALKNKAVEAFVEIVFARPVAPPVRQRRADAAAAAGAVQQAVSSPLPTTTPPANNK